jgi:hypothetical protein
MVIAICASPDSAAAFEQYKISRGWLRGALAANPRCETILLSISDAVMLERQVRDDGLVTQHRNLMPLLALLDRREQFLAQAFEPLMDLI